MPETLHLVCPACDAINRFPASRLAHQPNCGHCRKPLFNGHPLSLRAGNFARHISRNDIPVLVDFWASWCGPCKMMAPWFEQAAQRLEPRYRLAKVDTEAEPGLGGQYAIRSIPTLVLFRGGQVIARQSGAMRVEEIIVWAQGHI